MLACEIGDQCVQVAAGQVTRRTSNVWLRMRGDKHVPCLRYDLHVAELDPEDALEGLVLNQLDETLEGGRAPSKSVNVVPSFIP